VRAPNEIKSDSGISFTDGIEGSLFGLRDQTLQIGSDLLLNPERFQKSIAQEDHFGAKFIEASPAIFADQFNLL
jgi:hypothetical protein